MFNIIIGVSMPYEEISWLIRAQKRQFIALSSVCRRLLRGVNGLDFNHYTRFGCHFAGAEKLNWPIHEILFYYQHGPLIVSEDRRYVHTGEHLLED